MPSLFSILSWYLVFLFSLTAHEASHAFAAWRLGDPTAYNGGQVTLDPWPHIKRHPFGMVFVPLAMFLTNGWMIGWASAPYNPIWAKEFPKRAGLMALAGPCANAAIILLSLLLMKAGLAAHIFAAPTKWDMAHVVISQTDNWVYTVAPILSIAYCLNIILLLFNLIPLPPLDGAAALRLLIPTPLQGAYDSFATNPQSGTLGLLAAWFLFPAFAPSILKSVVSLVHL